MRPYCCHLLLFVSASIFFRFPPSAKAELDVPLDLAIVVRAQYWNDMATNVKNVLSRLPNVFSIGPEKTRVAVLALLDSNWTTLTNLTDSLTEYQMAVDKIRHDKAVDGERLEQPLETIREEIFRDSERRRVIIMVEGRRSVSDKAVKEAMALRGSGVWFSIISENVDNAIITKLGSIGDHVIQFRRSAALARNFDVSHLEEVKRQTDRWLCNYTSDCFFTDNDQSGCAKDWWTPSVPGSYGSCSEILPPPPPISTPCLQKECMELCDTQWPWEATPPNCSQVCGKTNISRVGTAPWKQLESCPRQFQCQECTTMTTTTMTTTTTAAAATATVGTSTQTSRAMETETADNRTFVLAATPDDSSSIEPWLIGLIVALLIAIISVVAVVGLLVYRHKRHQEPKPLKQRYGQQEGSDVDSATTLTGGGSGTSFTARVSPASLVFAHTAKSIRPSKSEGLAPTSKSAVTKSSPTPAKSASVPAIASPTPAMPGPLSAKSNSVPSKAVPTPAKKGDTKGLKAAK